MGKKADELLIGDAEMVRCRDAEIKTKGVLDFWRERWAEIEDY